MKCRSAHGWVYAFLNGQALTLTDRSQRPTKWGKTADGRETTGDGGKNWRREKTGDGGKTGDGIQKTVIHSTPATLSWG